MRLLTSDDLSRSKAESRAIVQAPSNPIGRAMQGLAGGVDAFGNVAAQEAQRQKSENDAIDLTRARSALQVELMREKSNYDYTKDQDYGTWKKRFDERAPVIHENVASLIRNPVLKDRFLADTTPEIMRYSLDVDNDARQIDTKRKSDELDLSMDNALEVATAPGTSKTTQKQVIDDTLASIDGLVKHGVYTPEGGAARRIKFTREFASRKAKSDVIADPSQAASWLRGEGAVPGALIKKKEDFRETPYPDGGTLRIGYGSDTITLADGSHIPVKAGMKVTRADADRDLKRRIAETDSGIVGKIGPDAWAKLAPGAQEALRSMAYNYGSLPDSVASAAKSGDPSILAQAVRARASDKGNGVPGKNAQRRFEEAAIIEGDAGKEYANLEKPAYYDFLPSDTRQQLLTGAEGEIGRLDKARTDATDLDRYVVKSGIDDDVSQIENTGKPTDLNADQVNAALGPTDTAKWLERRDVAAKTYAATSAMDSMNDAAIDEHLAALEPKAGTPDFASAQKIFDKVELRAKKLKDLRLKDPALSVEDSPIVKQAMASFDPEKPDTVQNLTKARLAAQDAVGIPDALKQPVTRKEAYKIIAPIQKTFDLWDAELVAASVNAKGSPAARRVAAKDAQKRAEEQIRGIIDQNEKTYGPYAQQVLAFAIAESVKDKEIGNLASVAMRKIANRETPTRAELQALDATHETSMAAKAVSGELPAPKGSAPPAAGQRPAQAIGRFGPLHPPQTFPRPTQPAVDELIRDPSKAPMFDQIYGPGSAETWLPAQ